MLREELQRELERELSSSKGQRVFTRLVRREPMLTEFPTVFDLINGLKNPKAPKRFVHQIILRLIGLYRQARATKERKNQETEEQVFQSFSSSVLQSSILAILLLVLWDDIERLTEEEHYKLWRIDDEPFSQTYFTYINLIAGETQAKACGYPGRGSRTLQGALLKGEHIKLILYDEAKEFIKEEYKRQCVYEI